MLNPASKRLNMLPVNRLPRIRLAAQLANDFVDNRLSAVDPLFASGAGSANSQLQTQMVAADDNSISMPDEATILSDVALNDQSQQFLSAVTAYEQSHNGKGSNALELVNSSSWSDVLNQVERVQRQYEGAVKTGFLGSLRGRLRSFGDCKAPVEAWLKLLPSQAWQGSLVCGGVMIVVNVSMKCSILTDETRSVPDKQLTVSGCCPPWRHQRRRLRRAREHTGVNR